MRSVALLLVVACAVLGAENETPKPGMEPGRVEVFVPSRKVEHKTVPAEITWNLWAGHSGDRAACVVAGTLKSLLPRITDFTIRVDAWDTVAGPGATASLSGVGYAVVKGVKTGQVTKWKAMLVYLRDVKESPDKPARSLGLHQFERLQVVIESYRAND